MKFIQLIYNPFAGSRVFKSRLDYFIEVFQDKGYEVRIHRTKSDDNFSSIFKDMDFTECKAIIVAGGDGSISHTVNAMKTNGIECPFGIIPAGTANDFAKHLEIPDNFTEAINILSKLETKRLDLGYVNGRYFVNVCSGGLLINISHTIEPELKSTLGKLAYYIKGVAQLPKFKSIKFKITANNTSYEENLFLFLVLNGSSAGGFNRLGEYASMKDGKLDFVGIRACQVNDVPMLFTKIMLGEHLEDKNILFFQSDKIFIENMEGEEVPTDIDGEVGPLYPLVIEVMSESIEVIVNNN